MSDKFRYPVLDRYYQRYLEDENTAEFIRCVSAHYSIGTLVRLADSGQTISRRAAVLMIGFVGTYRENETMGLALNDRDRAVRMLADHGIRDIWGRQGTPSQQAKLKELYRLVNKHYLQDAVVLANELIVENADLSEAWSQRAIAFSAEGDFLAAIEDCCEALNKNRYHFPAAIGMGHCCLQLDDVGGALSAFRLALQINPDLEGVRTQVYQLERASGN